MQAGLRLLAYLGVQVIEILCYFLPKVVYIFFSIQLRTHLTPGNANFSPMRARTLSLASFPCASTKQQ